MKLLIVLFVSCCLFCSFCYTSPLIITFKYIQPGIPGFQTSVNIQDQPESKKVKQAKAKNDESREKEEKAYEKAKAKDMKHRMDLQTPLVRERMKENKKLAEKNNDHYHKTIWQKIFGHRSKN
jgi:hypothetical protein